jgi:uncharacterized protein YdaL
MLSRRAWRMSAITLACCIVGCSSGDDGAARRGAARAPGESAGQVSNPFPIVRGDLASAREQAARRLGLQYSPVPSVSLQSSPGDARVFGSRAAGPTTLVLYDTTGPWGWLGELYAINVGSLVSHFGPWAAKPASSYAAGDLASYGRAVYVGSTFDEPLPTALLDDVLAGTTPVVWIDDNIWQLAARSPAFATTHGFLPSYFDTSETAEVDYKGVALTRYLPNAAGIMLHSSVTTATVLAHAVRTADRSTLPWALRGANLTYIGENPMAYVTSNDRYLAFCDLLFDAFAGGTPERHRALVRIEDVDAKSDPQALRAIADYLGDQHVPFGIAAIARHVDPRGTYNDGVPDSLSLAEAPGVAEAIAYMISKGGVLVMHGYTHQFASVENPYNGVSADDFEFYRSHIGADDVVVYDGPVPGDSSLWAAGRITAGLFELMQANLPWPRVFEYPHYAGSDADSVAVRAFFDTVYHRGLYFGGVLSGAPPNHDHMIGVMYPFEGRDVYGLDVIPENLGSYEPEASNHNPPRLVADILQTARANRVVRDGFASFYFHPYYPLSVLEEIVRGVRAEGYTFVSPVAP